MPGEGEPISRAAVIGWPLGHSISPAFQQAAFDALRLQVTYRAIPVASGDLPAFVASLRDPTDGGPPWLGVNVTIPHKQAVAALVDDVSEEARQIGAVNTLIRKDGRLIGHNTDAVGFLQGMRDVGVDPTGMGAIILGAGGAARAVAVGLLRAGVAGLAIANRSPERAESLCWTLQDAFPGVAVKPLPLDAGVPEAVADAGPRRPPPATRPRGREVFTLRLEAPLDEALAAIGGRLGLTVRLDEPSLTARGISSREIVRANVRDVSRDELLDAIVKPLGLSWRIDDDTLVVTAAD